MGHRASDPVEDEKPSFASNPFFVAFVVTLIGAIAAALAFWRTGGAPATETVSLESGAIERESSAPAPAAPTDAVAIATTVDAAEVPDTDGASATPEADETLAIRELSVDDVDTGDLVGGRIVLVSSVEPSVVVLDDGSRFAAGAQMPNGHVIASIERERIVLERDGVVSVLRLP